MKQNIYDNQRFFDEYDKMRKQDKGHNANDLIEIPNFRKLMPDVTGKRVLDLGCGYGENSLYCAQKGAAEVLGIDISSRMIQEAEKLSCAPGVKYRVMAMEDISCIGEKFDIVISSLAFHYVMDFGKLLGDIYALLNDGGCLVFSQEHPLVTCTKHTPSMTRNHTELDGKWFLLVSDYNRGGLREIMWNGERVQKYHRNFSEIVNLLIETGYSIDCIREPIPTDEIVEKVPKYIHQYDRPYFLFVKAYKR